MIKSSFHCFHFLLFSPDNIIDILLRGFHGLYVSKESTEVLIIYFTVELVYYLCLEVSFVQNILSFKRLEALSLGRSNEAYSEDYDNVDGHNGLLDWLIEDISCSTELYLVAASLLYCVIRMLWSINGWGWSNAISNLSTRVPPVTEGHN